MSRHRAVIGIVGFTAVGLAVGAVAVRWLGRSRASRISAVEARVEPLAEGSSNLWHDDSLDALPPDSTVFEPAPVSDRYVSARPVGNSRRHLSADDYEAISADDLGSAFLARATESSSRDDGDADDPLAPESLTGFQITTLREVSEREDDEA